VVRDEDGGKKVKGAYGAREEFHKLAEGKVNRRKQEPSLGSSGRDEGTPPKSEKI